MYSTVALFGLVGTEQIWHPGPMDSVFMEINLSCKISFRLELNGSCSKTLYISRESWYGAWRER